MESWLRIVIDDRCCQKERQKMKAVLYEQFGQPPRVQTVADPTPTAAGRGHQGRSDRALPQRLARLDGARSRHPLPHVPGHELAGTVQAVGSQVTRWRAGDRVTVPFVGGCGHCFECTSGNHQVCEHQFQPGFTAWGSFAEYVAIDYADTNLVRLPAELDFATAASLGCRFVTSFRAIVDQGRVRPGEWVAVHGCGGVGLSAIMIASAMGANVIAIDLADEKLDFAREIGAVGDDQRDRRRRRGRGGQGDHQGRRACLDRRARPSRRPASTPSPICAGAAAISRSG